MFVVVFEFWVNAQRREDYLARASALRPHVETLDGFLGIERFQNVADPEHMVSLSTWRDEAAIAAWRTFTPHRAAQAEGRARIFDDYRLRVGEVVAGGASITLTEGHGLRGVGILSESIVTPGKQLLVGGAAAAGDMIRTLDVTIVRSYGPTDRSEAPVG